jgi:hypothetical protein
VSKKKKTSRVQEASHSNNSKNKDKKGITMATTLLILTDRKQAHLKYCSLNNKYHKLSILQENEKIHLMITSKK